MRTTHACSELDRKSSADDSVQPLGLEVEGAKPRVPCTKTGLAIDEESTIATALFRGITSWCAPETFEMIVDDPFLMLLTGSESALPLFIGVTGDST